MAVDRLRQRPEVDLGPARMSVDQEGSGARDGDRVSGEEGVLPASRADSVALGKGALAEGAAVAGEPASVSAWTRPG